jgi:hypothetical protein
MAEISTLQDRPFCVDAEPYKSVLASTDDDEGFRFFRGLLAALRLSVLLYAGLGALLFPLLN